MEHKSRNKFYSMVWIPVSCMVQVIGGKGVSVLSQRGSKVYLAGVITESISDKDKGSVGIRRHKVLFGCFITVGFKFLVVMED